MRDSLCDEIKSCIAANIKLRIRSECTFNQTVVSVMSVDVNKENFWQATARSTIRERCQAIFNQELLSDVKFIVQDSQGVSKSKTIPAHKYVLAISSPVFHAMFYGELAETKDFVEISDCEFESLLELLRFIYSDEANLSPDNAMQLLYLAKKYMLPSLADKCSAYLQENLDASNVFYVLPDAQKYEQKDLVDHCWNMIKKETDEAVKSDGFVTIERSLLEELVEKDSLNIKEVELFKAVDCWAIKGCEKQGLVAEGSVKRRILGERIVKGIRFPVMEQQEFADVVLDSEILTHKETNHMIKYFNSVLNVPVEFPEAKRSGRLKIISRFRSLNNEYRYSSVYSESIVLTVDKQIKLHAVRLFGSDNSKYSVILTVEDSHNGVQVEKVTSEFCCKLMRSKVGDYYGEEIAFNPPIALGANIQYILSAKITGPPSWYGEGGQACVQHSGVKFFFATFGHGYQTSIQRGQFSEFVFTSEN